MRTFRTLLDRVRNNPNAARARRSGPGPEAGKSALDKRKLERSHSLVLLYSAITFIVTPLAVGVALRQWLTRTHGSQWFNEVFLPKFSPVTILALLATLVLIFGFQSVNTRGRYFQVLLIAIPILNQVYFNSSLTYGQMHWKVFSGALNAKTMIGFMKRLAHGRQKRVFLIRDNLRVHHSKAVRKWLKENEDKILVFYLPSYSPELNPDELLNADLRQHLTEAVTARSKIALTRTAIGALRSIQKQPGRVESYFGPEDVAYAA